MSTPARPLRRDAQRNHTLLIQAARDVFAVKGLDAPLDEIARRAGVSPGTLYHRFSTREALIEAAMQEHIEQAIAIAQQAHDNADPWQGLDFLMTRLIAFQAADRGFCEAIGERWFAPASPIGELRKQYDHLAGLVIERAKDAQQLRADFGVDDLAALVTGAAYAIRTSSARTTSHRLLDLLQNGIRG
jgi:AcrR family transcriptional regulator